MPNITSIIGLPSKSRAIMLSMFNLSISAIGLGFRASPGLHTEHLKLRMVTDFLGFHRATHSSSRIIQGTRNGRPDKRTIPPFAPRFRPPCPPLRQFHTAVRLSRGATERDASQVCQIPKHNQESLIFRLAIIDAYLIDPCGCFPSIVKENRKKDCF